jgi:hypothetical protein
MKTLIAIDDTDNLESPGTGEVLEALGHKLGGNGFGIPGRVTRHQLPMIPEIPYTSHNSSMCLDFELESRQARNRNDGHCASETESARVDELIAVACTALEKEAAPGSDPGLCVLVSDSLKDPGALLAYGREAKKRVIAKEEAYAVAKKLGIHLSEHGGTGIGVIGALAGVALRLSGSDGRFKGKLKLPVEKLSVSELAALPGIDEVRSLGGTLAPTDEIMVPEIIKPVLLDHKAVLLITKDANGISRTLTKSELKRY